jgi:hypothetical protein
MMPNQPFMNHLGGGPYNSGQGHGSYQNTGWVAIPQEQSFLGSWGQMPNGNQSSANPNGNQKPGGNKKKGHNNIKGGKNGSKPKDNGNNEKTNDSAGEGKREIRKVNFPCNLCVDDHLTHLCPKLVEVVRILYLPPSMLMNPFPHSQHMASSSSNNRNVTGGSQNPLLQDGDHLCINMVDVKFYVATLSRDYISSQAISWSRISSLSFGDKFTD